MKHGYFIRVELHYGFSSGLVVWRKWCLSRTSGAMTPGRYVEYHMSGPEQELRVHLRKEEKGYNKFRLSSSSSLIKCRCSHFMTWPSPTSDPADPPSDLLCQVSRWLKLRAAIGNIYEAFGPCKILGTSQVKLNQSILISTSPAAE